MFRDIEKQLKGLRNTDVNPRAEWVQKNRSVLMSQIKNTVDPAGEKYSPKDLWENLSYFFTPSFVKVAIRPLVILLIVSLVGGMQWVATADAAYEAVPGDFLYGAKRAVEKTQVAVASMVGNKKIETQLHTEFAKRRAKEVKRMVASGGANVAQVAATLKDLKQELNNVNNKIETANTAVTADVVKEVKQNTEEIKGDLKDVKDNLIVDNNGGLAKEVAEAKDAVKSTELKAVQVMVEKHLQGDTTVSKEEVKEVISNTLKDAAVDAATNKQNADDANKVVEAVKTEVKDLVKDMPVASAVSSSTKELTDKITVVAAETKVATEKTDVIVKEVDKKMNEAQNLLNSGDLAKAVDKVKEVSESSQKMEDITDKTIQNVQQVLPVMSVVVKDGVTSAVVSSTKDIVITVSTTPALNSSMVTTTPVVPAVLPSATVIINTSTKK